MVIANCAVQHHNSNSKTKTKTNPTDFTNPDKPMNPKQCDQEDKQKIWFVL